MAAHADTDRRNAIGACAGSYALYRALATASKALDPVPVPHLTGTAPAETIGPYPQRSEPDRIVSIDSHGRLVNEAFAEHLGRGWDIRPTIAVAKARINLPGIREAMRAGRQISREKRGDERPPISVAADGAVF